MNWIYMFTTPFLYPSQTIVWMEDPVARDTMLNVCAAVHQGGVEQDVNNKSVNKF